MSQDTSIYLTNIIIVTILAALITQHWMSHARARSLRPWVVSAWILLLADVLFVLRPELPPWIGRIVPTALVTLGQAVLLVGARRTAELRTNPFALSALVAAHVGMLVAFLVLAPDSEWRKVVNGVVWAGLSFASFWSMRSAPKPFWRPLQAPANAFLLHGVFHCGRVALASLFNVQQWGNADAWLQTIGDLEVSFFMVALFVSILIASLQMRNEELSNALTEVQTLAGLLPICAWCKKVRNDDGYWQKVEDYLATHSQIKFTHGICSDCYGEHKSVLGAHGHTPGARGKG
jgi:hypothetical protein